MISKLCVFIVFLSLTTIYAGNAEETVRAFERQPDYVRPIATLVGSMTNSGWYTSGNIGKDFSFSVALPISLIYLSQADIEYNTTHVDTECQTCREVEAAGAAVDCKDCIGCTDYLTPTIFGDRRPPILYRSTLSRSGDGSINSKDTVNITDGNEKLKTISWLPFISFQTAFSYYYTQLTLRYIGIPAVEGISFHFPGIGLQHDFRHLFPELPISLSLAANCTFLTANWVPGDSIEGTLKLNGLSNFLGVIAGYTFTDFLEVFIETGWDHSYMKPSGRLVIHDENGVDIVEPSKSISGRNAFRIALNVAFPIGYHPVLGGIAGADFGNTINILSFRKKNSE